MVVNAKMLLFTPIAPIDCICNRTHNVHALLGGWIRSNFAATVLLPFCEYAKICKQCAVTMNNCNFVGQMYCATGCSWWVIIAPAATPKLAWNVWHISPLTFICHSSPFHHFIPIQKLHWVYLPKSPNIRPLCPDSLSLSPLPSRPFPPFPEKRVKTNKHTHTACCKNLQPNLYWCLQWSWRDAWWAGNRYFIIFFRET